MLSSVLQWSDLSSSLVEMIGFYLCLSAKARPQLLLAIVLYTEDNNVLVKCGCSILQAVMCWKGRILHNS